MTRRLVIEVDCGDTTCGNCRLKHWNATYHCKAFNERIHFWHENGTMDLRRCPACLAAETKEQEK